VLMSKDEYDDFDADLTDDEDLENSNDSDDY
jgi:hypothetical protein